MWQCRRHFYPYANRVMAELYIFGSHAFKTLELALYHNIVQLPEPEALINFFGR